MQSAIIVQCTERVMSLHPRSRVIRYRAKWIWGRWLLQAQGYKRLDKDEAVGEISMTRIHTLSLFLSALSALSLSVSLSQAVCVTLYLYLKGGITLPHVPVIC